MAYSDSAMPLLQIIIALCIVGLVLWVVQQIPMDATIARIIRVVDHSGGSLLIIVLLFSAGNWGGLGNFGFVPSRR